MTDIKKKLRQDLTPLFDLVNLIVLEPSDNPQSKSHDDLLCGTLSRQVCEIIPNISHNMFCELLTKLDQEGVSFESYMSRQVSNLYFLIRLSPTFLLKNSSIDSDRLELSVDNENTQPLNILENGSVASINQLLVNYLTESWNWYSINGPTRNTREAIAQSRLYTLIREIVRIYGWWAWPFFYHFESSEHVDRMTKLVEDSKDERIPFASRTN